MNKKAKSHNTESLLKAKLKRGGANGALDTEHVLKNYLELERQQKMRSRNPLYGSVRLAAETDPATMNEDS